MANGVDDRDRLAINLILERVKDDNNDSDLEKFEEIKRYYGITKPNTEILKLCIRTTHDLLIG